MRADTDGSRFAGRAGLFERPIRQRFLRSRTFVSESSARNEKCAVSRSARHLALTRGPLSQRTPGLLLD